MQAYNMQPGDRMNTPEYVIVLITVPDRDLGEIIACYLLEQHLAACVNFIPQVRSHDLWETAIEDDLELLLEVKTRHSLFNERPVPAVKALHPYQIPEIIALPILMGSQSYLYWIGDMTESAESNTG
jgi:periplasmic divalent cation tolerance protein